MASSVPCAPKSVADARAPFQMEYHFRTRIHDTHCLWVTPREEGLLDTDDIIRLLGFRLGGRGRSSRGDLSVENPPWYRDKFEAA